jgi:hypothetical protein
MVLHHIFPSHKITGPGVLAVGVVLILAFCIRPSKPSNGPIVVINGAHVDVKALKQREQAAAQKGIQPVYGPNTADLPESHRAGAAAVAVQATPQMFARDADGNFLSTREQPMPSPRSQMGGNDSPPMLPPRPGPQMQVQQQPMLQQQMLHVSQVAIDQQANRRLPDIDQAGDRAYDHVAPIDPAAGMYVDIRTGARDDLRLYPQPPPRAVAAMPAKPASVNKAAPLVEMLPEPPMHGLEEPANQVWRRLHCHAFPFIDRFVDRSTN